MSKSFRSKSSWFAAAAVAAFASSSFAATPNVTTNPLDPGVATPHYGTWGFDRLGQDTSVRPGDDFFLYANGAWIRRVEIPSDRIRFGNFDVLSVLSENQVHAILEKAAASGAPATTPTGKIGAFYQAYMDEAAIEAHGTAPLDADLARVKAANSHEALAALMGDRKGYIDSVIGVGVNQDAKNPQAYTVGMRTGGLGLPDKDYYLKDTPRFAKIRDQYKAYIAQMLTLGGWSDASARAGDVYDFELELAKVSWDRADLRDRDKTYNRMSVNELSAYAPGFDFKRFLTAADFGAETSLVVGDKSAFQAKAAVFARTPAPVIQAWEAFHMIDGAAPVLPKRFVDARFAFRSQALNGQPEQQARWKRAVAAADGAVGEAVGEIYVREYFTPQAKVQMLTLVGNLKTAFRARLERLDWMSPATKRQALAKLAAFSVKIAYPDMWRDYSALTIKPDDAYGNAKRSRAFEWNYRAARLHKPVDRKEWGMTPQTVNAYYNSTMNEIVFPAAILQPPFFDPKADPAINYGGIGGVIGHEMSHGFDDQGRKSDGTGLQRDWWTQADADAFNVRADKLGAQYSAVEPVPGEHINGKTTMGENIGDMGGINLALEAYHASLNGKPAPVIDGLTGDQRVFLGWAQVWRGKSRDEALVQQLRTDPHSPNEARVNQVVRNVDAWYDAFDVKPGDKLYLAPADRIHIW